MEAGSPRPPSPSDQRTLPFHPLSRLAMADRPPLGPRAAPPSPTAARRGHASASAERQQRSLLGRAVQTFHHVHGSTTQLLGFLALAVTLTALLVLAGVTLTAALAALVLLSPLVLLTLPLWAPVAVAALLTGAVSLIACCAGVAAVAAGTWAHRYFTGRHPVGGAHRVESAADHDHYARGGTVADVASRVRGYYDAYAREYGGYPPRPHARVKDAAPGA
ncbi:oleosin 14.9 kDa [Sorghum bicolor]|nr:oleosin 14.9 kDa [Sorghum bicolor]|eukprot:XP_002456040.2 oleosin 14.9 kDa [Sorghum bicolor]